MNDKEFQKWIEGEGFATYSGDGKNVVLKITDMVDYIIALRERVAELENHITVLGGVMSDFGPTKEEIKTAVCDWIDKHDMISFESNQETVEVPDRFFSHKETTGFTSVILRGYRLILST